MVCDKSPLNISILRFALRIPPIIASLHRRRASSPVRAIRLPARPRLRPSIRSRSAESPSARRVSRDLPLGIARKALIHSLGTDFVDAWDLAFLDARGVFVLLGFGVAVEVQIHHDVPLGLAICERPAQTQHLARQHPPDQPDGVAAFVVGWDGDVDVLGWGVGVAERDDGDVDVGGFFDGLGVGARVGHDDEAGLFEGARDVVGEVAGGEAACDGGGAGVGGELEDGALAVRACRDDGDVGGVIDGCDDAGGENDFLPEGAASVSLWSGLGKVGRRGKKVGRGIWTDQVLPMLITFSPSGRVFQR